MTSSSSVPYVSIVILYRAKAFPVTICISLAVLYLHRPCLTLHHTCQTAGSCLLPASRYGSLSVLFVELQGPSLPLRGLQKSCRTPALQQSFNPKDKVPRDTRSSRRIPRRILCRANVRWESSRGCKVFQLSGSFCVKLRKRVSHLEARYKACLVSLSRGIGILSVPAADFSVTDRTIAVENGLGRTVPLYQGKAS